MMRNIGSKMIGVIREEWTTMDKRTTSIYRGTDMM